MKNTSQRDRFGIDWRSILNQRPGTLFWQRPHLSRRVLFRHLGAGVGGYFLLPSRHGESSALAASPIGKAKNVIFIQLNGGISHIDSFDLKEGEWTPAGFEPESYGSIRWPRGILPTIAGQLDSVALVRSVRSWAAVHQLARDWVQIARNPTSSTARIAPHIGSVASLELAAPNAVLPAFLALNAGTGIPSQGYFPPAHAPFLLNPNGNGLDNTVHRDGADTFGRRYELLLNMDAEENDNATLGITSRETAQFNQSARLLMYNSTVDEAFRFEADERQRYGSTGFGNACLTARNVLRAGLGARFIQITSGGWDNHANIYTTAFNTANANALVRQLDRGLGNLLADLKADGLLDQTLVLCMGEFGRTVGRVNAQAGRDHFLQQSALFAGAGIRGPKVIGSTNAAGSATGEPGWGRDRDVRPEDIAATLYSALGIDWTTVRRDDPLKRGFEYIPFAAAQDLYGPIHELWNE
ncbi:MAG: DUF1501 domain-containing protein [Bryobacteraceae bacterium]